MHGSDWSQRALEGVVGQDTTGEGAAAGATAKGGGGAVEADERYDKAVGGRAEGKGCEMWRDKMQ